MSSSPLSREEWEQFINEKMLDLYQGQMNALDLIEQTDRNLRELMKAVGKLADILNTRTVTPKPSGDSP